MPAPPSWVRQARTLPSTICHRRSLGSARRIVGTAQGQDEPPTLSAPAGASWVGVLDLFGGRIGDVAGGRRIKRVKVRSDTEPLDVQVPRNV